MEPEPLDRIHIRDLLVRCIVGVNEWEQAERQNVILNVTLYANLRSACLSDDIPDTVEYVTIKKRILERVESRSFRLLERLAETVAEACLENPRVERVDVIADKPGALRFARTVAVEITRCRS